MRLVSSLFVFILLSQCDLSRQEKCAQYWPTQEEHEMAFRDTRFVVRLLSENVKSNYTTRLLELQNANVSFRHNPGIMFNGDGNKALPACVCELFRQGRREKSTTFITPHGLILASQSPQRPSSTSCLRCASRGHWGRIRGQRWCTAAQGLADPEPSPWSTPVSFW